ncbi:MAG: stage 0 sporulation protein [Lachnospiraceae bacterium]|nr:stage 0 sporulation protein [Lachnospiraceae bacterium]
MTNITGVRFRHAGKVYYFSPGDLEIKRGDHVIVETARGLEYGDVMIGRKEVEDDRVIQPLKPVLRLATPHDDKLAEENRAKEKEAYKVCREKIQKHNLDMKLVDVEYTFDGNKILFYFTADGRIDFRELVKDLASVFRTRIELRQIGVRDETKILGGIGICGRPLCCYAHQSDFIPVSIKMAKEQNLSLNPSKISGVCGRLMCCLKYEQETYEELNSRLPGVGDYVTAADGSQGEVSSVNVLRQTVKVIVTLDKDEKEIREYPVAELKFRPHRKKEKGNRNKEKAFEEKNLKEAEALDGQEKAEGMAKPERRGKMERREKPERKEKSERRDRRPNQERRRGKAKSHDKKSETV